MSGLAAVLLAAAGAAAAATPRAAATPSHLPPLVEAGAITCDRGFLLILESEEKEAQCLRVPVADDGPEWKNIRYRVDAWSWNAETHRFELAGVRSEAVVSSASEDRLFPAGPQAPGLATQPLDPELPAQPWQSLVPKGLAVVAIHALPGKEPRRIAAVLSSRRGTEQRQSLAGLLIVDLPAKGTPRAAFGWTSDAGEASQSLEIEDFTGDGFPDLVLHTLAGGADRFHIFELTGR